MEIVTIRPFEGIELAKLVRILADQKLVLNSKKDGFPILISGFRLTKGSPMFSLTFGFVKVLA